LWSRGGAEREDTSPSRARRRRGAREPRWSSLGTRESPPLCAPLPPALAPFLLRGSSSNDGRSYGQVRCRVFGLWAPVQGRRPLPGVLRGGGAVGCRPSGGAPPRRASGAFRGISGDSVDMEQILGSATPSSRPWGPRGRRNRTKGPRASRGSSVLRDLPSRDLRTVSIALVLHFPIIYRRLSADALAVTKRRAAACPPSPSRSPVRSKHPRPPTCLLTCGAWSTCGSGRLGSSSRLRDLAVRVPQRGGRANLPPLPVHPTALLFPNPLPPHPPTLPSGRLRASRDRDRRG